MNLDKPKNPNYAAVVVVLKEFAPIPKADRIKSAIIFGNSVIVSKDAQEGELGLFFPVETQLSHEFTSANNLYRHAEMGNIDSSKTGYLETHRRIKCAKFLGVKSEGLWIPLDSLQYLLVNPEQDLHEGDTFDRIGDNEICCKYIAGKGTNGIGSSNNTKTKSLKDTIVDGQFKFHFDTDNFRKNIHKIYPTDTISISDKFHGSSIIVGKPLVLRNLCWYERILRKIGVAIRETEYALTYSSRKVIKSVNRQNTKQYYGTDIWGVAAKNISDRIPTEYTIYGELVGYTPEGSPIQKGYSYGCEPKTYTLFVYRVITTNNDGKTLELSWSQMQEFCATRALEPVKELFHGKAKELVPYNNADITEWQKQFLNYLETRWVHDQDCRYNPKMPAEGIVIRRDSLTSCESWKLKNFRFMVNESKELDNDEVDIETAESIDI